MCIRLSALGVEVCALVATLSWMNNWSDKNVRPTQSVPITDADISTPGAKSLTPDAQNLDRPLGVTFIAVAFFLAFAYLCTLAVVRLTSPGVVPLSWGAPLLHGLELAGPYAFLLAAALAALVGIGLLRMKNLARRAAIVICAAGMFMLIPKVSSAATDLSPQFFAAGAMLVVRVMMVWYLWQSWTAEKFN